MSHNKEKKPKYVGAYIRNIFNFYKLLIKAIIEQTADKGSLEIIQAELFSFLERRYEGRPGESTVIKYINELEKWKFLQVNFKKIGNRYFKHLKPTIRGVLLTKLYDPEWNVPERFQAITKEMIPTAYILFENNNWIREYNKMLESPTLLDILTMINGLWYISFGIIFEKLLDNRFVVAPEIVRKGADEIKNRLLSQTTFMELIEFFIPSKPFDIFIKSVNDLDIFIERINVYLLTLIYFTIKAENERNPNKYYHSNNKYCLEFNNLVSIYNELKFKDISFLIGLFFKAKFSGAFY